MSSLDDSRRWRMRAEELRTMAGQCKTAEARESFLRLAKD